MTPMNRQDAFDRLVAEAIDALPESFREKMDNVEILVEDWPDRETLRLAGLRHPEDLLGFYHGVPLTQRSYDYGLTLPDKISIYREPILARCRTWEEVRAMAGRVVRHEVAHYFGIDDERLHEIGAY
jgi:predicted Zn-dependent protease with MMP-like domain